MAEFKFYMFFVWAAAMVLACWAFEVARVFARRVAKHRARSPDLPAGNPPRATVILPLKGVDDDTEENVRALLQQEYPQFRLLFAVESADDPVVPLLEKLRSEAEERSAAIEIVIAGIATERGQKIHNQLAALDRTTADDEILVFMDADARPKPHWLAALILPLQDESVGATTGFRFYVPADGNWPVTDCPPTMASAMVSVINAGVAALLGPGWRNMAWGGSMAIRRENFFGFGINTAWQHALSDDYVLSWCVKNRAKRRIRFVQACLVGSVADFEWPGFWEFAVRQYRITKICAPAVWLTAIGAATLYLTGLLYTATFYILSLTGVVPANSLTGQVDHLLLLMFAALYIANVLRGWLLLQGGIIALPEQARQLRKAWFWYTLAYPVSLAVNLLALLRSAPGRKIEWRGVTYIMHNRLETTVRRPAAVVSPTSHETISARPEAAKMPMAEVRGGR